MSATDDGFRHRQIDIDASSLHVVEAGDPDAPAVLFLHGWPASWRCWDQVMTLAAPDAHVVAIDLPGIGGSTGDATDGSTAQVAEVARRLAVEMGLSPLTVVGHDLGAWRCSAVSGPAGSPSGP
jgi:pimeloyl-ACP methyl ester carboxylesterase